MKLRVGLIGAGLAGPLFAGAFSNGVSGAELIRVCSRREDLLRAFCEKYGVESWTTDWRELIADPDIDVVCIATPTGTHAEMAIEAARKGKHVLVEKPISVTLIEADSMIRACTDAKVQLGVIYMYRFMDTALAMKQAIESGLIGDPILGECSGKFFRDQSYYDSGQWRGTWTGEGGGALMTQTSHTLDLLLWMLGEVRQIAGFHSVSPVHRIETEDLAVGVIRFKSGALGSMVSSSAITPPVPRSVTVHGTRGTIRLEGDKITQWSVAGGPDQEIQQLMNQRDEGRGDTLSTAGFTDSELHRRQITEFVDAVRGGRSPLVDGWEGRKTLEVMLAIYESSNKREILELPN